MLNVKACINKRFAVKNSGVLCVTRILFEQSENENPAARRKSVQGCETIHMPFLGA